MSNILTFRDFRKQAPEIRPQAMRHFNDHMDKSLTKSDKKSVTFDELHAHYKAAAKGHKHTASEHEARLAIAKSGFSRVRLAGRERVIGVSLAK